VIPALDRVTDLRALDWLRVAAGPITILHLWPFVSAARNGDIYRDTFYEPYASWYPELPRAAYIAVLCVGVLAALAMALRLRPRLATVVAFAVVAYNLFLSTTHFHNNRAFLLVVLGGLALAPEREGPAWPLHVLRLQIAAVYGGSGLSKLVDPEWFGGRVTWGRVVKVQDQVPDWLVGTLTNRTLHTGFAKVIVLTELFIAVGLLVRRTRDVAVVAALLFHISIALTADVQVFSVLGIAALVIWRDPEPERRGSDAGAREGRRRPRGATRHGEHGSEVADGLGLEPHRR
jgi:vitamin K-dependent gamma-carboxylase